MLEPDWEMALEEMDVNLRGADTNKGAAARTLLVVIEDVVCVNACLLLSGSVQLLLQQ